MIHILHVIDSLDLGGAQTALLNLIQPCDCAVFHHEVAAMHGRGMFADAFESAGIPVHSLSARRCPPAYVWRLPALLRRGSFDVVHCHLFGANWVAKPIAFFCGCRVIYNHDQCNDAFRNESRLVTWIDAQMNRFSTRILPVSQSISRYLQQSENIPASKISYLPNSVDLESFHPASLAERTRAREIFGLPAGATVIGGVGRLVPQKQFETFVAAATELHRRRPDWIFVLFGSGPDEQALRAQAASLGSAFRFAGTSRDRAAIYHAIDVQVLPSRFEGMPMTILEGMASGLPVVATRVDGVLEMATDRKHVLLVNPGDVPALVQAISEAAEPTTAMKHMCLRAQAHVEKAYNSKTLSDQLHAYYREDVADAKIIS